MKMISKMVNTYDCGRSSCFHASEEHALKCVNRTVKNINNSIVNSQVLSRYINTRLPVRVIGKLHGTGTNKYTQARLRKCVAEICEMFNIDNVPKLFDITNNLPSIIRWNKHLKKYKDVLKEQFNHFNNNILNQDNEETTL